MVRLEINTYWKYYDKNEKLVEIKCCDCGKTVKSGSDELLNEWTVRGLREQTEFGIKIFKWYYCCNCCWV